MKKIAAVLLGATLALSHPIALAAEDISVTALYDANSNKVIINGKAASGDVIIVVKDSEGELSADSLPYDFLSVKSEGEFETTLTLNEEAGGKKLSVIITDSDGDMAEATFMNPDFSGATDIIADLNKASDAKEFSKIVSDNAPALGIDTEDELYQSSKSDILAIMYAIIADNATGAEVYSSYYTAHALASFDGCSREECEEILRANASLFAIDYDKDYVTDERLDDASKKALCKLLSVAEYSKVLSVSESFADFLEKSKAVAVISSAEKWQDIKTVMEEDFADLFVLTVKGSKAQQVYGKMMKYDYNEFDDIAAGYKKAIKAVESDSEGGSSSGSGSSGGFSGSSVKLPTDVEIKIDESASSAPGADQSVDELQKKPMITLPESGNSNFHDVPSDHWCYNAVSVLTQAGVVSGYPYGSFGASDEITRAEFTKLVCTTFGIPQSEADFADVPSDAWFNGYVGGATKFGIVAGYGDTFGSYDHITRQDAAVIIYRALKNEGIVLSGNANFEDYMDISLYALTAVGALNEYGIMVGDGSNFNPKNDITRAEAAQLIFNAVSSVQNI